MKKYKHIPYGIKFKFAPAMKKLMDSYMNACFKAATAQYPEYNKLMGLNRKFSSEFGPIGRVVIELIDHKDQRYETAGDWFREEPYDAEIMNSDLRHQECTLHIRSSRLKNDPDNFFALAVAYHELGEALACIANGITEEEVDDFDIKFKGRGEPGDDPRAPYSRYHNFASACESILIGAMGLSWGLYEKAIDSLPPWRKKHVAKS